MKKLVLVFGIIFILCLSSVSANWFGDIFYGKKNVQLSPELESKVQSCLENVCSDFGSVRKQACLNSNLRRVQCERESEMELGVRENENGLFVENNNGMELGVRENNNRTQATKLTRSTLIAPEFFSKKTSEITKTLKINKKLTKNEEISLQYDKSITSASFTGKISILSDSGYVRIVLRDANGKEYLIFGSDYFYDEPGEYSISNVCEETCAFSPKFPYKIYVDAYNGNAEIEEINLGDKDDLTKSAEISDKQITYKVNNMNKIIKNKGYSWVAGKTEVSKLSYQEKKELFGGELPNLGGFDMYKGGIFIPPGVNMNYFYNPNFEEMGVHSVFPESFDWRDRHGENWMTDVKRQIGGTCSAHGVLGALEAVINLYYNQHLDKDLSEHDLMSCAIFNYNVKIGDLITKQLNYIKDVGVVDDNCFPYQDEQNSCYSPPKCNWWQNDLWKIRGYYPEESHVTYETISYIKNSLIKYGPLAFMINYFPGYSMAHEVVLTGYGRDQVTGFEYWIFKNSWGLGWGEEGYGKMIILPNNVLTFEKLIPGRYEAVVNVHTKGSIDEREYAFVKHYNYQIDLDNNLNIQVPVPTEPEGEPEILQVFYFKEDGTEISREDLPEGELFTNLYKYHSEDGTYELIFTGNLQGVIGFYPPGGYKIVVNGYGSEQSKFFYVNQDDSDGEFQGSEVVSINMVLSDRQCRETNFRYVFDPALNEDNAFGSLIILSPSGNLMGKYSDLFYNLQDSTFCLNGYNNQSKVKFFGKENSDELIHANTGELIYQQSTGNGYFSYSETFGTSNTDLNIKLSDRTYNLKFYINSNDYPIGHEQTFAQINLYYLDDLGNKYWIDSPELSSYEQYANAIVTPITPPNVAHYEVVCIDKDNDDYYNWGIGEKPNTCPSNSIDEEDCDDSNNQIKECPWEDEETPDTTLTHFDWDRTIQPDNPDTTLTQRKQSFFSRVRNLFRNKK